MVTVHLPEALNTLLERVIVASGETSESVLLDWILHSVPIPNAENFNQLLDNMSDYSQIQLWTVVYLELPPEIEARHQAIVEKHDEGQKLTPQEQTDWDYSVELGEIYTVLRSKALSLLQKSGTNIDIFLNRELG